MAIFFLIRHAATDHTGNRISGRSPGVHLDSQGRSQAEKLAKRLAASGIQRLFSSPLERACETAAPLAKALGLSVQVSPALTDIDFGDWSGRSLAELELLESWKTWNLFRSSLRIPNGEMMPEVQSRMMCEVERLYRQFSKEQLAIISHADPIRCVLAHYLGTPMDLLQRMEISPASVSIVEVNDWGAKVRAINLEINSPMR
jgi:probable phosphoglycerate mutase